MLTEAFDSLCIGFANLKETICTTKFQHYSRFRRNCCELDIAIALYGFLQATQKKIDSDLVHLEYLGAVEDDRGSVNLHATLQFVKEEPPVLPIQSPRHLLYSHNASSKCHISILHEAPCFKLSKIEHPSFQQSRHELCFVRRF
jgi:hypothetical protein